ncbi:MAG: helix-turn-helix transcriptional regulator [Planctomycetota bacterium]
MTTMARDRIRRCLAMIPLIRARPGIRIPELASIFGVHDSEIWEDITEVLTFCGVPPYLPHNYLVFSIHGDRVSIRFAEHLSRPVHLTLQEALAIDLALRTVSGGSPPVFGDAAPRLREKLRRLLGGRERVALAAFDRGVAGRPPPDLVTETIALLKQAMSRNFCVEIEYYTASRDRVSVRTVDPYGLIDHRGRWYVVARDHLRERELPFRVDRIRTVRLLPDQEYEVPDSFTTERYRRDAFWREGPEDIVVKVAFSPEVAPRIREEASRRELRERPDGGVVRTYRIQRGRPRWLYTQVARFGPDAEILAPADVRRGMAHFLDAMLGTMAAPPLVSTRRGPGAPRPREGSAKESSTRGRPKAPRARRKPPANRGG